MLVMCGGRCEKVEDVKIYEFGALGSKNVNLDIETYTASNRARRPRREDHESITSGSKPLGTAKGIETKNGIEKIRILVLKDSIGEAPVLDTRARGPFLVLGPFPVPK